MQAIHHIRFIAATILMLLHATTSNKSNARPVYEVINEQARIDDNIKISNSPSVLPYGNPLAGNQNARIHISNQQAMFQAEKVRQHRAQLQRLAQAPRLDSYMRAYHESQDNLQFAIEQQQATQRDNAVTKPTILNRTQNTPASRQKVNTSKKRPQNIPEIMSRSVQQNNQKQESSRKNNPTRKTDGARNMKYRGQRSYGAIEYQQYLNPQKHKFVYLNSIKNLAVTIKPNGNIGVTTMENKEPSKLYTEAIPSNTINVYPKQYNQMQYYKTTNEAETSDLPSKINEGLSAYSSVQNSDTSEIPIDFYFYLKDPSKSVIDLTDNTNLSGNTYASAYMSDYTAKDHTPITENVDDIEDPNAFKSTQPFIPQTQPRPTPALDETTTTKSNHYYKIEVASQILTSKHKPAETKEVLYYKQEDDHSPSTQTLHYPSYPAQTDKNKNKYIHQNAQNTGVQHLSEDGFGVSAFADDLHYAAKYEFGYRVHDEDTGNFFGHSEAKDGDQTNGHYHVLLPDGRMQKVQYSAGPQGYHADISYEHLQRK